MFPKILQLEIRGPGIYHLFAVLGTVIKCPKGTGSAWETLHHEKLYFWQSIYLQCSSYQYGSIIEYLQLLSGVNFSTNHMTFQIVLCCGVVGYCVIWESNNCLHHALLRNRNIVHTLLVTFQWHSWMSFFTQSIKRTTLKHQQHKKMTRDLHNGLKSEILFKV